MAWILATEKLSDYREAMPETTHRRVLLAVTGLSPQIVTETLFALAVRGRSPWLPTEVHIITTAEGGERARLALLHPRDGWFHRLRQDYDLEYGTDSLEMHADSCGPGQRVSGHAVDAEDRAPDEDAGRRGEEEGHGERREGEEPHRVVLAALREPEREGERDQKLDERDRRRDAHRRESRSTPP